MREKLKKNSGFTMVEMLCAVAILVLLCLMMNTGLQMATQTYRDITVESELELLVNTVTDALEDKLRYAVVTVLRTETGTEPNVNYTYTYEETSIGKFKTDVSDNGWIMVEEPVKGADGMPVKNADGTLQTVDKALLPEGAYGQENASGQRRYQIEKIDVTPEIITAKNEENKDEAVSVTFTIQITASERGTVSGNAGTIPRKEETVTIRCLNPPRIVNLY